MTLDIMRRDHEIYVLTGKGTGYRLPSARLCGLGISERHSDVQTSGTPREIQAHVILLCILSCFSNLWCIFITAQWDMVLHVGRSIRANPVNIADDSQSMSSDANLRFSATHRLSRVPIKAGMQNSPMRRELRRTRSWGCSTHQTSKA
jgi:hypothetical protein